MEKWAIFGTMFVVSIVLSFLFGYVVAEAEWFTTMKSSILQMLGEAT